MAIIRLKEFEEEFAPKEPEILALPKEEYIEKMKRDEEWAPGL